MKSTTAVLGALVVLSTVAHADDAKIRDSITLYASFDKHLQADQAGGAKTISTRFDHPTEKGKYEFQPGHDEHAFRIDRDGGLVGGALRCVDVLPRRGRMFFPAKGNIAYDPAGWSGTVSMWLNMNPDTMLKTSFCDPVQITHRGAHDGGLWCDFPNVKPRDMRMGIFPGLRAGERPVKESDPRAAIVRQRKVGFKSGEWHHVALVWKHFDTGRSDAEATFWIDGKPVGTLNKRELAMRWDIDRTGIYVAVALIGMLDEFAVFDRALSDAEVKRLHAQPALLAQ